MKESSEFLLFKINELEKRVFELEKKLNIMEEEKTKKAIKPVLNNEDGEVVSTRFERYKFNGEYYKKAKLVLAVIKKFVEDNPNITEAQLSSSFPSYECKCSYQIVKEVTTIPEKHLNPVKRYYVNDEHLIKLTDNTIVAVCNQWGQNIHYFIKFVEKYGYNIEKE